MFYYFHKQDRVPEIEFDRAIYDEEADEREWKAIHRAADKNENRMKLVIIAAAAEVIRNIKISDLRDGFNSKSISQVEVNIRFDIYEEKLGDSQDILRDVVSQGGQGVLSHLSGLLEEIQWDLNHSRILNWVEKNSGEFITDVSKESREAVRESIRNAFVQGVGSDRAADQIVQIIGLTKKQAAAVDRFRNQIISDGESVGRAMKLSEEYSNRLRRYRAEVIARTELMKASNEGVLELYRQGVDQGIIEKERLNKEWILTPDDRLCEYCAEMAGVVVPFDKDFDTPFGPVQTPPMHPMCRCTIAANVSDSGL